MRIDLAFATGERDPAEFAGKTVVVIDVLRASSTILTALANGCPEVIPVAEPKEAFALAEKYGRDQVLLGGEREARKIRGFDLGNSPDEYGKEVVAGKKLIFTTTNGAKAFLEAAGAAEILVGAFLNISRVCSYLKKEEREIFLFCAGRKGRLALEDLFCAGMIIDNLIFAAKDESVVELTDPARAGMLAYRQIAGMGPVVVALTQTDHGRYLASLGMASDLRYCGQVDLLPVLARLEAGGIILAAEED
ncbi:MAG: 2-phosphosulfolactate phosphatase [Firmicutes bacterium]|nr:2-phosphosulfolactate phosphatase [Bacillota bacterium]